MQEEIVSLEFSNREAPFYTLSDSEIFSICCLTYLKWVLSLFFCTIGTDTWPTKYAHHKDSSGFDNIIGIGACDKEGFRLGYTQDSDFPFLFLGKDVYVGPIPFVKSEDYVNGSSVATAIAAGVASLTLSCHRLANNHVVLDGKGRYRSVREKFQRMSFSASNSAEPRYVLLQRFVSEPSKRPFEKTFSASSNIEKALTREFGVGPDL